MPWRCASETEAPREIARITSKISHGLYKGQILGKEKEFVTVTRASFIIKKIKENTYFKTYTASQALFVFIYLSINAAEHLLYIESQKLMDIMVIKIDKALSSPPYKIFTTSWKVDRRHCHYFRSEEL